MKLANKLVCYIFGHAKQRVHKDGLGARWHSCGRCGFVVAGFTKHQGRPWE